MPDLVRTRRDELCATLAGLDADQWNAETLCAGWDAGDVAAHLIAREREPWTAPGIVFGGPLAALTDRRVAAWKARGRGALSATLAAGPPWPLSGPLADVQIVEDWIHEQDVRRGGAGLPTTPPVDAVARLLWIAAKRFAIRTLAVDGDLVTELTDGARRHRVRARSRVPLALPTDAPADVVITGPVGELLLFVAGRDAVTVTIDGTPQARALLTASPRSL
ncbi:TIGR03085 family metal-binding protein [soil metagenome]